MKDKKKNKMNTRRAKAMKDMAAYLPAQSMAEPNAKFNYQPDDEVSIIASQK